MLDGPYLDVDLTGAYFFPQLAVAGQHNIVKLFIQYPEWDANYSYGKGALVVNSGNTAAFISLVDQNLNHNPDSAPTYWGSAQPGRVNGPDGFTSGDIGRCIRLKSEPLRWAAGTTYDTGDPVTYNNLYYTSVGDDNTGNQPDLGIDNWLPTTSLTVAKWTWGKIIAINTDSAPLTDARMTVELFGDNLLYEAITTEAEIRTFRFGLYGGGAGHGWPTCGIFHEGRLWLAGAVENRIDGSNSNEFFNFAPTLPDGTVADNNSISAVFNSKSVNQIFWLESIDQGIVCGTLNGEWLVRASQLNDPLTPTSIQAKRVTKYGCANVEPVETGLSLVFVQKFQRKLMEFLPDVYSGKFSAPNLAETSKHLTASGVVELAYQEEPIPTVWARKDDGTLCGISYRRTSSFTSEAPAISAWHKVAVGNSLAVESICVLPALEGTTEVLAAVVYDSVAQYRNVVQLTPMLEEDADIYASWFLDNACKGYNSLVTTSAGVSGLRVYGLWHLNGQNADVFIGGLDCGTVAVSNGNAFVPFANDADGLCTLAYLQALSTASVVSYNANTTFSAGSGATAYTVPMIFGFTYSSIGQSLRPGTQQEAGAYNGPPSGKTRRAHQFSALLFNCVHGSISVGTVSTKLRPASLTTAGGTPLARNVLFTGTYQNTLEDDYNYDTMLYWKITRPYPATILQVGAYLHTQDR